MKPMLERLRAGLATRFMRNSTAVMVGNYTGTAFGIVTSIVLARVLGPVDFGLLILATTAVNTVVQFMDLRTSEGLVRFMGEALTNDDGRAAVTYFLVALAIDVLLMVLTVIAVWWVSPLLVSVHPQRVLLASFIGAYASTVPFNSLKNTFRTALIVTDAYWQHTIAMAGGAAVQFVALTLLAFRGPGAAVWGYVIGAAANGLLAAGFAVRALYRVAGTLRGEHYRARLRKLLPFTVQTSLMQSLKSVAGNVDVLLLGALQPIEMVTFYRLARSAASLIAIPFAPVGTVLYPTLTAAFAKDDVGRVRHLVRQFTLISGAVGVACVVGLLLLADFLVLLFYGASYSPTANALRVMAVGVALENSSRWMRPAALAKGRPGLVTFTGLVTLLTRLALVLPLVMAAAAVGAAWAYTLAVIVSVGLNVFYTLPRIGVWGRATA